MTTAGWWEEVTGSDLAQGDMLDGVEVPLVTPLPDDGAGQAEIEVETVDFDVIVLTQTCDLEHAKQEEILVARVVSWIDFAAAQVTAGNQAVRSREFARNLRNGTIPPLHLLRPHDGDPTLPWSLVHFRELHTLARSQLQHHAGRQRTRLRLLSPYREHLGQAFARFFMRVGLPLDVGDFERLGPEQAKQATAQ